MTDDLAAAKQRAKETYNAAADTFDDPALGFWTRYGTRTVERLRLAPGAQVLDVCCGTGASALPAAAAVGPTGRVTGVDLAADLLELARAKAEASGTSWVEFRQGDMTALPFDAGTFDAVVCVFAIFFVPDMEAQVAELWRFVRPGGQLAITTWGPDILSPAYEHWLAAVSDVRPDLVRAFRPWDRITTPEAVRQLFADAGIREVDVVPEEGWLELEEPGDFWTIARGSGLRWTIDQLGPEGEATVRDEVLGAIEANDIDAVATNVIYAVARKPGDAAAGGSAW